MEKSKNYLLKLGTAKVRAVLEEIHRVIDGANLNQIQHTGKIEINDVAECTLRLEQEIACDLAAKLAQTSRFVIVDNYEIAGGGIVQEALEAKQNFSRSLNLTWHAGKVTFRDRCRNLNQKGLVVLFTGLSGSGKSTIAVELEKELFRRRKATYILDGDNIRHGLNNDLGFTVEDREENIRRVAEVAALFKDAGLITLVSVISPSRKMRALIKEKVGKKDFLEVYVKADLEICAARDPKGLYQKAQQGELLNFTGITAPYEEPEIPDLLLDTAKLSISDSVAKVLELIEFELEQKNVI